MDSPWKELRRCLRADSVVKSHSKETVLKHLSENHPEGLNMALFHCVKLCLKERVEMSSKKQAEKLRKCSVMLNKAPPGFNVQVNPERMYEDEDWLALSSD